MQQANATHFANEADVAVPSWFATDPNHLAQDILLNDSCHIDNGDIRNMVQDAGAHHGCVLDAAAGAVAALIQTDSAPAGTHPIESLRVQVQWTTQDTIPLSDQATIQLMRTDGTTIASQSVALDSNQDGVVTFDQVPFTDMLVTTSCGADTYSMGGALPGFDRAVILSITLLCQ